MMHQTRPLEIAEGARELLQAAGMIGMTPQGRAQFRQELERRLVPVIGMEMGEDDGPDASPADLGEVEKPRQLAGADAEIDEHALAVDVEIAGVAAAAAGQDGEAYGH